MDAAVLTLAIADEEGPIHILVPTLDEFGKLWIQARVAKSLLRLTVYSVKQQSSRSATVTPHADPQYAHPDHIMLVGPAPLAHRRAAKKIKPEVLH